MQLAIELVTDFHLFSGVALLATCRGQLEDSRPEADRVIMPHRALIP
jgi:hypothetical protein